MLSLRKAFTVAGLATGAMALALTGNSAYAAGSAYLLYTTDDNPGGDLDWWGAYSGTQDKWVVCDNQADGYAAKGTVTWSGGSTTLYAKSNGDCTYSPDSWNLAEGTKVTLKVCLNNAAEGDRYCHTATSSA
ncbi:hypothetical protein [Streptomyces humi]|uniref:hypothetical protein n=1 Tax=Streptomyces humi TaxID=1428620 RepID=UPI00062881AD|nr:hypothetical protein [Streptomyces humi]